MRIAFMGTPEFAVPSLKILHEHKYDIRAVVTSPDKPRGRGQQVSFTPVKELALQRGFQVFQPANLKDSGFINEIGSLKPDIIVVVAFRILPQEVFRIPRLGSFNLHASLLPKYRGAAPINWAIINGETETGVTSFLLAEKVDTGSVVLQARVRIGPDETAGDLHDKLAEVGAEIVLQTVRLMELGKAQPRQQDHALTSPAPKIMKEHSKIDWKSSAQQVHNFVRGMSPTPCAWTKHRDTLLKIYRTNLISSVSGASEKKEAGHVVHVGGDDFIVQTGDGIVKLLELQQEGKKRLPVGEFLRGYAVRVGDKFE
ncbi:MAG: methionyl-tRNA formyltransferase [Bacteroidota bacterium]